MHYVYFKVEEKIKISEKVYPGISFKGIKNMYSCDL